MKENLTEIPEGARLRLSKYIIGVKDKRKLGFNQLSLKSGLNPAGLNRIIKGSYKIINPYHLKQIASALRIDYKELYKIVDYLDEDDCENKKEIFKSEVKFLDAKVIELPVYGKASAGKGHINLDNIIKYKRVIANGFSPDSFIVEVTGDSMSTIINDEDIVIVDPQLKDYVAGKVYVVTYGDETYIKQVQCPKKNMIVLKSFNPKYDDKYIIDEEIKELKIEGRVVKIISERRI